MKLEFLKLKFYVKLDFLKLKLKKKSGKLLNISQTVVKH